MGVAEFFDAPVLPGQYVGVGQSNVDVTGKYNGDINAAILAEGHGKRFIVSSPVNVPAPFTLADYDVLEAVPGAALTVNADQTTITVAPGAEAPAIRNVRFINNFTGARTTYDILSTNPYEPTFEDLEMQLSQAATAMGGIHFAYDAGQPGTAQSFLVNMDHVKVRNGLLVVDANITDGKVANSLFWGTYTGALGTIQLGGSDWDFINTDVVPPQGEAAGYLINGCSNVSIIGGLLDGSYNAIQTGHGIQSTTGAVRGLSVIGAKFYNLGRSGIKMFDVRRASILGCIFVQNNKSDNFYPDVDLYSSADNAFVGNTHGAPNARANKGLVYREDAPSSDNAYRSPALEASGNNYNSTLVSLQTSSVVTGGVPTGSWPSESVLLAKNANYTISKDDLFHSRTILYTAAATNTFPSAGSVHAGNQVTVKASAAGAVTLATTGGQTIDGAAPGTLAANAFATYMSDGANWQTV